MLVAKGWGQKLGNGEGCYTWAHGWAQTGLVAKGWWQRAAGKMLGGKSSATKTLAIPYLVAKGKGAKGWSQEAVANGCWQKLCNGGAGNTPPGCKRLKANGW